MVSNVFSPNFHYVHLNIINILFFLFFCFSGKDKSILQINTIDGIQYLMVDGQKGPGNFDS